MSSKDKGNFLQLPILDTFEPLTKGTNLPSIPPSPVPSSNNSAKDQDIEGATTRTQTDATTPPRSPVSPQSSTRPGSMRRFLSRVSLNSNNDKESIAPPLSPTGSIMSVPGRNPVKKSWWSWGKSKTPQSIDAALEQAMDPPEKAIPTRQITPPPKLPDLKSPPATFEDDLFKNIK